MHQTFKLVGALASAGVLVIAVAACGSSSGSPTTGPAADPMAISSGPAIKPQPGHVITNPTAADSYIYTPTSVTREGNGNILIVDAGNWDRTGSKIVEMNPQGKPIWVYTGGLDFAHSAYPIDNGKDLLVSDTNNDRVFIINRQGQMLWNTDNLGGGKGFLGKGRFSNGGRLLYPNDAVLLSNGHILISSRMNSTVYEIDRKGKVYWSCARFMNKQHRPRLLPNGNLMVADSDNARAVIINHACNKIVWQYGGVNAQGLYNLAWPRSFNVAPNGDYIIGDSLHGRIIEITKSKKLVHQWTGFPAQTPYYIEVQPNGDMLFADNSLHGAVELAPSGKLVHTYGTQPPGSLPTSPVNGGFETGQAQGWTKGDLLAETLPAGVRATMSFDTHQKHSGKSSAKISWNRKTPHNFLFWSQAVTVQAGHTYKFTGWIKTKHVAPCNGCNFGKGTPELTSAYSVGFIKPGPYAPPLGPSLPLVDGTTNWKQISATFTVPSGVIGVTLNAELLGKGTVWFDDVSLTETK